MIEYKEIIANDIEELSALYADAFNAPPWHDKWTQETATRRLHQLIHTEDFFGLGAFMNNELCGMILGNKEQYYDGMMFFIKEFCVKHVLRGQGIGSQIFTEFESRLKSQGVVRTILFTSGDNGTADFYINRGFKTFDNMVMMGKPLL